ncbi:PTS transporter subunit EIIC, partial [Streptococcus pneumoniae]
LWFVGIHGPSIVLPAVTALQLSNMEENAQLLANGQFPYHSLTPNFGNYIAAIGGTGATFVVPFILIFFMRSKQLKSVGKATITPVLFAVNEPLLFGMPVILNPYLFVPFLMTPPV